MFAAMIVLVGSVLVVAGVAMFSPRVALVVAGVIAVAVGLLFVDLEEL